MDLFKIIFDALSPYFFAILKLALAFTLFSNAIKILRSKMGSGAVSGMAGTNPFQSLWTAFFGYLFGRGIPVIIAIVDKICNDIIRHMGG